MASNYLPDYLVGEMVEHYQAGELSRRDLLRRVLLITGSVTASATALAAAGCSPTAAPAPVTPAPTTAPAVQATQPAATAAAAAPTAAPRPVQVSLTPVGPPAERTTNGITVPESTPGLACQPIAASTPAGTVFGYMARPEGVGPYPALLVIHENRGLEGEHYNDVARRFATNGYAAFAIDLLSPRGGTSAFADTAARTGALGQLQPTDHIRTMTAGIDWLLGLDYVKKGGVGVTGYCFGGGMTWLIASNNQNVRAGSAYYGPSPNPLDQVRNIRGEMLGVYGGTDARINAGIPALEEALRAANVRFEMKVYEGAGHAFNNDTSPSFNATAAREAWAATIALFNRVLKA
jgi:carboxymethylenebutenolidase